MPAIEQTVRHAMAAMQHLAGLGADPLGLDGATDAGEPIITIRQPGEELAGRLGGRKIWAVERPGHAAEEGWIASLDGCYVVWTAQTTHTTTH